MDIEILSRKENVILGRFEVEFKVAHPRDRTPKRSVIRGQIAEALGLPKMQVVVDHMDSLYGISETRGYAKGYKDPDAMLRIERKHILKRNGISVAGEEVPEASEGKAAADAAEPSDAATEAEGE